MPDRPSPSAAVSLQAVSKHYGLGKDRQVPAADDVSLAIEEGAFVALTGASGSGKSTLLHLIGAIDRPDSGIITSHGTEVTARWPPTGAASDLSSSAITCCRP
jgi:putative ABC transport system ATP-binding protein